MNQLRGPAALTLRLLPKTMLPPKGLARGVFGFALLAPDDGFSLVANLYFHLI